MVASFDLIYNKLYWKMLKKTRDYYIIVYDNIKELGDKMGKTLYFAKVNINDEKVFKLYDGSLTIKDVMTKLFVAMNDGITYRRFIPYMRDGEERIEEENFS